MIKAALFDIDGTLIDSNDLHVEAWQQFFAEAGHGIDRSDIHEQIGKGGDNLVPLIRVRSLVRVQDGPGQNYRVEIKENQVDLSAFQLSRL